MPVASKDRMEVGLQAVWFFLKVYVNSLFHTCFSIPMLCKQKVENCLEQHNREVLLMQCSNARNSSMTPCFTSKRQQRTQELS